MRKPGYLLAQAVILALWTQDWGNGTEGVYPDRILLPEAVAICFLGLPPALAVGVADGRSRGGLAGATVLVTVLVLLFAAWIAAAGLLSMHFDLLSGAREPSAAVRVFVLFVVEVVFMVEVITAYLMSRHLGGSGRS